MKANFKKQKRKIPFTCMGFGIYSGFSHMSQGDMITMNNSGPYCHHCANMITRNNQTRNVHQMNKTMET